MTCRKPATCPYCHTTITDHYMCRLFLTSVSCSAMRERAAAAVAVEAEEDLIVLHMPGMQACCGCLRAAGVWAAALDAVIL